MPWLHPLFGLLRHFEFLDFGGIVPAKSLFNFIMQKRREGRGRSIFVWIGIGVAAVVVPACLFLFALFLFSKEDAFVIDLDPGQYLTLDGRRVPVYKLSEDREDVGSFIKDGRFWTRQRLKLPREHRLPTGQKWAAIPPNSEPILGGDLDFMVRFEGKVPEQLGRHVVSQTIAACREIEFTIEPPPKQPESKPSTVKCSRPEFTAELRWGKVVGDWEPTELTGTIWIDRQKLGIGEDEELFVNATNWEYVVLPPGVSSFTPTLHQFFNEPVRVSIYQVLNKYPVRLTGKLRRISFYSD